MKLVLHTFRASLLFIACTMIFYYGILWVTAEFSDFNKYDEPEGKAIKVSTTHIEGDGIDVLDRMKLFYLIGE
ncbi:hypothetical protein JOC54_001440 [Alkalihalobacillus xiaoxiensis]|uniref:DUF4227 family protein n=1 Tax=Shouchella xiaoxiensis TaxID=766895 RepID=A0ABS2SUR2_9BACI|nr:YqzK family protein [Shouchella xiaoxiensis]MBM7838209.1 hypothetical protein [Shouchella xiaoxiensis]